MACQTCGEVTEAGDAFCGRCGADLNSNNVSIATRACSNCGHPHEESDKFCASCGGDLQTPAAPDSCSSCGHPVSPDDKWCGSCGSAVSHANAVARPTPTRASDPVVPTSALGERLLQNWRTGATAGAIGLVPGLLVGLLLGIAGVGSTFPALFAGLSLTWRTTLTPQSLGILDPSISGGFSSIVPTSGNLQIGALFSTVLLISLALVIVITDRKLATRVRTWADVAVVAAQPAIVTGIAVFVAGIVTKTNPLTGLKAAAIVFLVVATFAVVKTGGAQESLRKVHAIVSTPLISITWAVTLLLTISAAVLLVVLLTETPELDPNIAVTWVLGIPWAAALILGIGTFAGPPSVSSGSSLFDTSSLSNDIPPLWVLACLVITVIVCLFGSALMILRRGDSSVASRDLGVWSVGWFVVGLLTLAQLSLSGSIAVAWFSADGRLSGPTAVVLTAPIAAAVCWWISTLILSRMSVEALRSWQSRARSLPRRRAKES